MTVVFVFLVICFINLLITNARMHLVPTPGNMVMVMDS